jgi:zinc transport system substrate-binding protein
MKKILFIIGIIVVLSIYSNLGISKKAINNSQKIKVETTLFPLFDFVKNIGQSKVDVSLLLPPNVEPHSFEPKPGDILRINESDLFVYTSKFMEPWANDIIEGISGKNIKVVDASAGIEFMKKENNEHNHQKNGYDPHIWLDFANAQKMIDNIASALAAKDFNNANFYKKNASTFKKELSQVDEAYKNKLSKCRNKEFIYSGHYAFGYLAKRYGLTYNSVYGVSPDSEPKAKQVAKLVAKIKKDRIKYIFYEELLSPEMANMLAIESGVKLLPLNPAHNLTREDYKNGKTYLSIMEDNLKNLTAGLGCNN